LNQTLLETQDDIISGIFDVFTKRVHSTRGWNDHGATAKRIENFNMLCDLLKQPKMRIEVPDDLKTWINAYIQACDRKYDERRAIKDAALRVKAEQDLAAWKSGGPLTDALRLIRPQLIRITGETVETTQGAQVPLKDAIVLLKDLMSGQAEGLILGQAKIGGFQLTEFDGETVTIGCHRIRLDDAKAVLESVL
jgi:hypothetical protein